MTNQQKFIEIFGIDAWQQMIVFSGLADQFKEYWTSPYNEMDCPCGEQMDFPNTFDEFAKAYGFRDSKEIYTNGSELIPVFRVKQWLEHISSVTPQEPFINKSCVSETVCEHDKKVVLDKIRAEIEQTASRYSISRERGGMGQVEWSDRLIKESEVLKILDKYKEDRSVEE